MFETCIQCTLPLTRVRLCRVGVIRTRITVTSSNILNLSTDYKRYRHSSTDTKLIRLGFVIRTRITCIHIRIANDICIRVRITGIRVRIAMRGRIAEVVLGCSGHYIDPRKLRDHFSFLGDRGRVHDFEHEQRLVYDFTNRGPCYANSRTAELDPSSHQLC